MDFWRIFENFGFAVLALELPTFCFSGDISNLTCPSILAAVPKLALAQKPPYHVFSEDTMGFQKSDNWSHGSHCPLQELVHKLERTIFWGWRKYNKNRNLGAKIKILVQNSEMFLTVFKSSTIGLKSFSGKKTAKSVFFFLQKILRN